MAASATYTASSGRTSETGNTAAAVGIAMAWARNHLVASCRRLTHDASTHSRTAAIEGVAPPHAFTSVHAATVAPYAPIPAITTTIHSVAGRTGCSGMHAGTWSATIRAMVVAALPVEVDVITSAIDAMAAIVTTCTRTVTATMSNSRTVPVVASQTAIPNRTTMRIKAVTEMNSAMSATIGKTYMRTNIVEVTTIVITVDREEPTARTPYHGTEEIVGSREKSILPIVQDATQVVKTVCVIVSVEIGWRIYTKEIVEIYFVSIVVLLLIKIEFVRHLVRQIERLCLCTFKTHCPGTHPGCHQKHCGENKPFHNSVV